MGCATNLTQPIDYKKMNGTMKVLLEFFEFCICMISETIVLVML